MTLSSWQVLHMEKAEFDTKGVVIERLWLMLQALSDLMALPAALSQHVQLELRKVTGSQAIGLMQPGHCIWHVKRLSKQAQQIPLEALDSSAPFSSIEYVSLYRTP